MALFIRILRICHGKNSIFWFQGRIRFHRNPGHRYKAGMEDHRDIIRITAGLRFFLDRHYPEGTSFGCPVIENKFPSVQRTPGEWHLHNSCAFMNILRKINIDHSTVATSGIQEFRNHPCCNCRFRDIWRIFHLRPEHCPFPPSSPSPPGKILLR